MTVHGRRNPLQTEEVFFDDNGGNGVKRDFEMSILLFVSSFWTFWLLFLDFLRNLYVTSV